MDKLALLSHDLIFNFLLDQKKREINKKQRADLINQYMVKKKISGRELARQIGIPHSTIQDWLLWEKISTKKISELKNKGITDTMIYRNLRNHKNKSAKLLKFEKIPEHKAIKFDDHDNTFKTVNLKSVADSKILMVIATIDTILKAKGNNKTNKTARLITELEGSVRDLKRYFKVGMKLIR